MMAPWRFWCWVPVVGFTVSLVGCTLSLVGCTAPAPAVSEDAVRNVSDHEIWISDRGADSVIAFDAAGSRVGVVIPEGLVIGPSSVRVGRDGMIYVASFGEAAVVRFDPQTGTRTDFFDDALLEEPVELLFLDHELCVLGNDTRNALVIDNDGNLVHELHPVARDAHDFAVGPDDGLLYVASGAQPGVGAIQVWDVAARTPLYTFGDDIDNATSIAFGPDGTVFVADYAGYILQFDPTTRTLMARHDAQRPVSIEFGPDGVIHAIDDRGVTRGLHGELLVPREQLDRPRSLTFFAP